MLCPNCGMNNTDDSIFCVACGTRIAGEQPAYQVPVQASQPAAEAPAQVQQPVYEAPVQPQPSLYENPIQPQQPIAEVPVQPQQPVYQQPPYQQPAYQQPVYQPPYQPAYPAYQQAPVVPGKGMGVAGMVLGIVSLVFCCCTEYISVPCAVIGLILSIIAVSKAKKAGMNNGCAVAGIVCSVISLVITVVAYILIFGVFADVLTEMGVDFYDLY